MHVRLWAAGQRADKALSWTSQSPKQPPQDQAATHRLTRRSNRPRTHRLSTAVHRGSGLLVGLLISVSHPHLINRLLRHTAPPMEPLHCTVQSGRPSRRLPRTLDLPTWNVPAPSNTTEGKRLRATPKSPAHRPLVVTAQQPSALAIGEALPANEIKGRSKRRGGTSRPRASHVCWKANYGNNVPTLALGTWELLRTCRYVYPPAADSYVDRNRRRQKPPSSRPHTPLLSRLYTDLTN